MPPEQRPLRAAAAPPLGLYLHLPWCLRKCPYCDFNSHEIRGGFPEVAYVEAVLADLALSLPALGGRRIDTVFFGGGTPSLFSGESIGRLLDAVRGHLATDAEVTLEANPGAAEAGRFAAYRAAGVTRLSLGIQSFDDRGLAALGRVHDAREARRCVELAGAAFERVNLDIMHGLPGQTAADAARDVAAAIASGTSHLSCYQLTLEPNTVFHRYPPVLPRDETLARIEEHLLDALAGAGFERYEVSAYARSGAQCRHNLNYWRFGDYLGVGAGAHSKFTADGRAWRETRARVPASYMRRAGMGTAVAETRELAGADRAFEFLLNALRLTRGFTRSLFETRTGLPASIIAEPLERTFARGLLESDGDWIRATVLGRRFLNLALEEFLPG
jgi:oxygen-independent coproporphyrinogen-3 oxidase